MIDFCAGQFHSGLCWRSVPLFSVGFSPTCRVNMDGIASELKYTSSFANVTAIPLLYFSLAIQQRHAPKTTPLFQAEYDYIVVGAGSAGSAVASRLSEMPCVNVLLLEAGKSPPVLTEVPALARIFFGTDLDWKYFTTPQAHTGAAQKNRQISWPSGKALGGSSIWNAMLYVRGNRHNYDTWAKMGATGWSYKDVLPYFKKMEGNREPDFVDIPFHGFDGPVTVETPPYDSILKEAVNLAALEEGILTVDSNGRQQKGLFNHQATMRNGQRCSTAKAYLVPADDRPNLDILPETFVTKILVEDGQAIGVRFHNGGQRYTVLARKEVILSAGTVNSAQLLMLSGIGPKEHLEEHKINVVADLPVGLNLQDHCATVASYEISDNIPSIRDKILNPRAFMNYVINRKGPLTSTEGVNNMMFGSYEGGSSPEGRPDYQIYFVEADVSFFKEQLNLKEEAFNKYFGPYMNKTSIWCISSILNPKSRGTVKLQSSDPYDSPVIDPNFLEDPDDVRDVVEGLKKCDDFANTEALQRLGAKPYETVISGCEDSVQNKDEYLACVVRSVVITLSHPVGTVKMGRESDPTTVVDSELRVKGIKGLRVVDASVMPTIPSGNTNAPAIMIGEKASDIIKKTIKCDSNQNTGGRFEQRRIIP